MDKTTPKKGQNRALFAASGYFAGKLHIQDIVQKHGLSVDGIELVVEKLQTYPSHAIALIKASL